MAPIVTRRRDTLRASVRRYCRDRQLLSPGTLVVAVSGGADSVCLLYLLCDLAPEFGLRLHVAHFNHMLRGDGSDGDACFVAETATRLGLDADFGCGDVGGVTASARQSLEAVAHDMRWAFLEAVRQRVSAVAIATGHTADDQAETVLMHLLRGAGLRGLAGMASSGPTVCRPLLATSHAAIVAWCQEHEVPWREDASNAMVIGRRNAIRLNVMPFLRGYNPSIDRALTGVAEAAQVDLAYLDEQARAAFQLLVRRTNDGVERLALAGYLALPEALRRQVLLLWLGRACRRAHVKSVDALLRGGNAGDTVVLPGNRQVVKRYTDATLEARSQPPRLPALELAAPGVTNAPGWGWKLETTYLANEAARPAEPWSVDLDARRVGLPLTLRPRCPGDRFVLPELAGHKKLQDMLVDAKIPRRERDRLGVVEAANGIVWLVGWRAAAWAQADSASDRILRLTVAPNEEHIPI